MNLGLSGSTTHLVRAIHLLLSISYESDFIWLTHVHFPLALAAKTLGTLAAKGTIKKTCRTDCSPDFTGTTVLL